MIIAPENRAPDFRLPDQFGSTVDLAEVRAESVVILAFFPFAFSPVCGDEIADLNTLTEALEQTGESVEIIGVSCDSKYTLAAWSDSMGVHLPLCADFWPHGEVSRSYGVLDEVQGVAERGVVVIAQDGTIVSSRVGAMTRPRDFTKDIEIALTAATKG